MDSGTLRNQSLKEKCMKSTILNLIAAATLIFSWSVHAAGKIEGNSQSPANPPAATSPDAASRITQISTKHRFKHAKLHKRARAKSARSHSLDLRHCLELESNAAIAQCANE
jgi:hypothetical protein